MPKGSPISLFNAERDQVTVRGDVPFRTNLVGGMNQVALRISVDGFNPPPSSVSFRNDLSEELMPRRDELVQCDTLMVKARCVTTITNRIEIVLIERDGTPWGTEVDLTTDWRVILLPLSSLRHFAHWGTTPQGRGGRGDWLLLENFAAVNVCFGAWLFPNRAKERHIIEIEEIVLVKSERRNVAVQ